MEYGAAVTCEKDQLARVDVFVVTADHVDQLAKPKCLWRYLGASTRSRYIPACLRSSRMAVTRRTTMRPLVWPDLCSASFHRCLAFARLCLLLLCFRPFVDLRMHIRRTSFRTQRENRGIHNTLGHGSVRWVQAPDSAFGVESREPHMVSPKRCCAGILLGDLLGPCETRHVTGFAFALWPGATHRRPSRPTDSSKL